MEAPSKNPLEELELPMSGDLVSNLMSVLKKFRVGVSNGYEF